MPQDVIDRTPNPKYERFIGTATKNFMKDFKHGFPSHTTSKRGISKWLIKDRNLPLLKNIFMRAIEDAIKIEDFELLNEEYRNKIKELKEIISNAKEDIAYINKEVDKMVGEEI